MENISVQVYSLVSEPLTPVEKLRTIAKLGFAGAEFTADFTQVPLEEMKKVLEEIQDGTFASKWIAENNNGRAHFNAKRALEAEQPLEKVGTEIRKMYSWNDEGSIIQAEEGKTKL